MKLQWQIEDKDVVRVKELVAGQAGNALIRARQEHNLAKTKPAVTKERFWRAMVLSPDTPSPRRVLAEAIPVAGAAGPPLSLAEAEALIRRMEALRVGGAPT